jgi:uncharacterized protein (TIGR00661 family)
LPADTKINVAKDKPLLLIAPLDWGLGHTTRCIPLLHEFAKFSCTLIVACNSRQKMLLQNEFPTVHFVDLQGYDLVFSRNGILTLINIVMQVPKMLIRIKRENRWLKQFASENKVDVIVSDNRYGMYTPGIKSIFLTHQLSVKSSLGRASDRFVQRMLYRWINRFSICWVPDFEGAQSIAGSLSNPKMMPQTEVKYLGCISRFEQCNDHNEEDYLLIILSGPEPQRSILEGKLVAQLKASPRKAIIVRGIPDAVSTPENFDSVKFLNHASAVHLNKLICDAKYVITRSGYSTIMDLIKLKKKMILIPTPGQTEQEYLGSQLLKRKMALTITQKKFQLDKALQLAEEFDYNIDELPMDGYKKVVKEFMESIVSNNIIAHTKI